MNVPITSQWYLRKEWPISFAHRDPIMFNDHELHRMCKAGLCTVHVSWNGVRFELTELGKSLQKELDLRVEK